MDTDKQRQCTCNDARLTKSGNTRSEQLLVVPTESLTNREWLPGELLSGSKRRWFLDTKYQTCSRMPMFLILYVDIVLTLVLLVLSWLGVVRSIITVVASSNIVNYTKVHVFVPTCVCMYVAAATLHCF